MTFAAMSAVFMHDPVMRKWSCEAIASISVALLAAWSFFGLFFYNWSDYEQCCRRCSFYDSLSPDQPDLGDRLRGFVYNAIWLGILGVTFYFIHKLFG